MFFKLWKGVPKERLDQTTKRKMYHDLFFLMCSRLATLLPVLFSASKGGSDFCLLPPTQVLFDSLNVLSSFLIPGSALLPVVVSNHLHIPSSRLLQHVPDYVCAAWSTQGRKEPKKPSTSVFKNSGRARMDQFLCSDGQPLVWFCLWHTGFAIQ